MCGIAGVFHRRPSLRAEQLRRRAALMTRSLAHRGPDHEGLFVDAPAGVALGHRRLAVVDLSPSGHQPMVSHASQQVMVFNGMIYNFRSLRRDLERAGSTFRGTSDTEILLEAWAAWGPAETLTRLNGMFALAVWDRKAESLTLARDRLGEKPLLWAYDEGVLSFGSELQALTVGSGTTRPLDRAVVAEMLRWSFVPPGRSVLEGIRQLGAGQVLHIGRDGRLDVSTYWCVREAARRGAASPATGTDGELVEETSQLLEDAVGLRMASDVPLGCFLSGGVDSALVTALAARSAGTVRTFTAAMEGGGDLDESGAAAAVAARLGTEHTSVLVSPRDVQSAVDDLSRVYDEPFADPSALPVLALARATRRHVTVALSGDGGDELFGGYNRYAAAASLLSLSSRVPDSVRRTAAGVVERVPWGVWERVARPLRLLPGVADVPEVGSKVHRAAGVVRSPDLAGAWLSLAQVWPEPPVRGVEPQRVIPPGPGVSGLMLRDQEVGLPCDMLTKVDRATMSVALEARVPLLDHRLVEWSWRLPDRAKIRDGRGKWVLRQVLRRHVPDELVDRPKAGFDPPIGAWLRGPLRLWAAERLSPAALASFDLVDPGPVGRAWAEHVSGRADHSYRLWSVLMLHSWLDRRAGVSAA